MKLQAGEVHIWSVTLNEDYYQLLLHSYLSEGENVRAKQFANDIDAFLFSARHKLLRIILGGYLNCNPNEIEFKIDAYQKPYIYFPTTEIQFNVSKTSNRFVAAVCLKHCIGVDIELTKEVRNIHQLIADYFTNKESDWIYAQPQASLESAFFGLWTKKEALVKGIGQGLSISINKLDVLSANPIVFGSELWYITPLFLFDDCNAALAINTSNVRLNYFYAMKLF